MLIINITQFYMCLRGSQNHTYNENRHQVFEKTILNQIESLHTQKDVIQWTPIRKQTGRQKSAFIREGTFPISASNQFLLDGLLSEVLTSFSGVSTSLVLVESFSCLFAEFALRNQLVQQLTLGEGGVLWIRCRPIIHDELHRV